MLVDRISGDVWRLAFIAGAVWADNPSCGNIHWTRQIYCNCTVVEVTTWRTFRNRLFEVSSYRQSILCVHELISSRAHPPFSAIRIHKFEFFFLLNLNYHKTMFSTIDFSHHLQDILWWWHDANFFLCGISFESFFFFCEF